MKYFFSLLSVAKEIFGIRVFIFGIAAGISNAALISIINETIRHGAEKKASSVLLMVGYTCALAVYFTLQYFYQALLIRSSEALILQNRVELIRKIRESSLRSYERIGSNKLFVLLAQDTNTLGQIAMLASNAIIALIVITGSLLYLSILSFKGFLLTILIIAGSLAIAFSRQKINIRRVRHVMDLENRFLDYMRGLLLGIKEVKMDSAVNNGLYNVHVKPTMEEVSRERADNSIFQSRFALLGQLIFFVTMGCILYLFPVLKISITRDPAQFVIVLLYILAPIQTLIPLIPHFSQIKATVERLDSAKAMLEADCSTDNAYQDTPGSIEHFSIQNLVFKYKAGQSDFDFSLGPINIDIQGGDLIFIHGSNGSGKSTLIKVLSGLYTADAGSIHLNNALINSQNIQQYRNLFGVIFTDNHLFEYVYDAEKLPESGIQELITKVGLSDKVKLEQNRFSTIDLSEGQKKRIALVGMLLKDKPIYIFDEWAANQDPEFRHFFYTVLIPELSMQKKIIIVITHDERYLHIARRVFKMEDGRLRELSATPAGPAPAGIIGH
jgi:putative ATP-binding cassette transporter